MRDLAWTSEKLQKPTADIGRWNHSDAAVDTFKSVAPRTPAPSRRFTDLTDVWPNLRNKYARYVNTYVGSSTSDSATYTLGTSYRDLAILPGRLATQAEFEREKQLKTLVNLLKRFTSDHTAELEDSPELLISSESSRAAIRFLKLLPLDVPLPRLQPDGEGCVTATWNANTQTSLLAIIEGSQIHIVKNATTKDAKYYDDIDFSAYVLPPVILEMLPRD